VSKTHRFWSFPLLALALVAVHLDARADECGNIGPAGFCRDSKTLVWCADGHLLEMVCPADEVCVADARFGPGGSGCLATQYTDCGQVTQAGQCAGGDRAVVWCDANRVKAHTCDAGTACAWVADEGWFDCVPTRTNPTGQSGGPDDNTTSTNTDTGDVVEPPHDAYSETPDAAGGGPLPAIEKGGASGTGTIVSGGAGCTGAEAPATGALALALVALLALLARRRERVFAKR